MRNVCGCIWSWILVFLFFYPIIGGLVGLKYCQSCLSCTNTQCKILASVPLAEHGPGDLATKCALMFNYGSGLSTELYPKVYVKNYDPPVQCNNTVGVVHKCFIKENGNDNKVVYWDVHSTTGSYFSRCPRFTWSLIGSAIAIVVILLVSWICDTGDYDIRDDDASPRPLPRGRKPQRNYQHGGEGQTSV